MRHLSFTLLLFAFGFYSWTKYVVPILDKPRNLDVQQTICGASGDACQVQNRRYNILLPKGDGPFPVILFFHGSGGSGDHSISSSVLVRPAIENGYAVIAPSAENIHYDNGLIRANWVWEGRLDDRDDYAFVQTVLKDAALKFPIDRNRVLMTGHSRGATFIWYYACANKDHRLNAFAPSGGTPFVEWKNQCAGKTPNYHLLHTHGTRDTVVKYLGTPKKSDWYERFGAYSAVEDFADRIGCKSKNRTNRTHFELDTWSGCIGGYRPTLASFEGGHELHRDWVNLIIDWFESLP